MFPSSTQRIPASGPVPRHIAIIMDGNGRWAKERHLPRLAGHQHGAEAVRRTLQECLDQGAEFLTLFAFSSENWRRPREEVSFLQRLFLKVLQRELSALHEHGIRFKVIGDLDPLERELVQRVREAEALTRDNGRLTLTVAVNYGGRWDILRTVQRMLAARPELACGFTEADLAPYWAMHYAPEPDLFIRTGGEQRISNFLLWQLAYTELYFTETLWPDFDAEALRGAIRWYRQRERRFGRTSEQLQPGRASEPRGARSSP
jgi:undecaprenyl diphosphate synthase